MKININKKLIWILLLLYLFTCFSVNNASAIVNDQKLATNLSKNEVDTSLASGWNNDTSLIFTTIFDDTGKYRGYRTTQIFKNSLDKSLMNEYKQTATNVCNIFELNETNVDYENEKHEAIDFICMQSVGNEGVITLQNDDVIINKNYGKTNGYLVGVQVFNKSFSNVVGGEVKNDILFILSNDGGSAKIIDKDIKKTSDEKKSTIYFLLIVIMISLMILIFLLLFLIKKSKGKKTKKQKEPLVLEKDEIEKHDEIDNQLENKEKNNVTDKENKTDVIGFEKGEHYEFNNYGHDL